MQSESGRASALSSRLAGRREEIEAAILARVYSVSDPLEAEDASYAQGLRAAVGTAVDYGLSAISAGQRRAPPVPAELLAQARLAARTGVSLDTVLRRYFAGFALLGDFMIEEAQEGGLFDGQTVQRMLGGLSGILDRLVAAVSDEYARAAPGASGSTEERRASHVRRLLAGEFLDASELAYDFEGHHLGLVAFGPGVGETLQELAARLDRRLLSIAAREQMQWAWLGSGKATDPEELRAIAAEELTEESRVAIGEPSQGMEGWRLTHRQAKAALPVARQGQERTVRYADVALLASILQDDLLVTSLRRLYLEPLEAERDGGEVLRRTLRAYFEAERNVSSTAAALGVTRKTVTNRLGAVEGRLGRSLSSCTGELDAALYLDSRSG
jgi:PucR-like helix-turn-helix protein/diguanylate cyclase with GGDEF domain